MENFYTVPMLKVIWLLKGGAKSHCSNFPPRVNYLLVLRGTLFGVSSLDTAQLHPRSVWIMGIFAVFIQSS